jgi:DNA-binding LytR/AlgR family response regulator
MKASIDKSAELIDILLSFSPSEMVDLIKKIIVQQKKQHVVIFMNEGYKIVSAKDIILISAKNRNAEVYLNNGTTITSNRALAEFEDNLRDCLSFLKMNKSNLINVAHVKELSHSNGKCLVLSNGIKIDVENENYFSVLSKINNVDYEND